MKTLRQGLCLVLLGTGLAAVPLTLASATAPAAAGDKGLVQQMKDGARGSVSTTRETATATVGFVRASGTDADLFPEEDASSASGAAAKSDSFLDKYAEVFGAPADQLVRDSVRDNGLGWTVTYRQRYRGVDVFGAMLRAIVDRDGDLASVNGYAAPKLDMGVTPGLNKAEAGGAATAAVKSDPPGHKGNRADTTGVRAVDTQLVVYRTGVPRGDQGKAILAYAVEVSNGHNVRDMVFVNARSGKVVNRYSLVHDALERRLYEEEYDPAALVWEEGDDLPGDLTEDQQNIVLGSGESYWFFANAFGQDSYDFEGAPMESVNNDPRIACPNANWNGVTTNYCNGVTADDVVAHEWGHAYTEYSWDGIYQWQPGALNESYSDIWGETVDLINGRQDEDEGDINQVRTVGQCSSFTRGDVALILNSPPEIAKTCEAAPAQFGPVIDATGFTDDVIVAQDDPADGSPTNGCGAYTNAATVTGNFAYVDRGACTFQVKLDNAEAAGATGIIVADNVSGRPPISMSAQGDIPGLMITLEDGAIIKGATGTVNATMEAIDTAPTDDTSRWLIGEKSTAFGGAIRDMWNPNCYGHPGKVTDAQYHCTTDDGGGVHRNSGVPNHAYSLLVDGGTYNDVTVAGIGLDRAAAIYYVAMVLFQTPTTDFTDHADALEASCDLLVEEELEILELTTESDATPTEVGTIAAEDCDEVTNAIAAVELRTDPVQCNFQPLLEQGGPSLCGSGFTTQTVWKEAFEDGLTGWERDFEIAFPGGLHDPWQADSSAPGGRAGGVARGPSDPDLGDCTEGAGDASSRDSIISPLVTLPDTLTSPKLSFDHYVATEFGFDGGNVKVSINESAFTLVPDSAYLFNEPNAELQPTNPLAGEAGFTGSDGGEVFGSWGTSFIDLAAIGAGPGDQLRIRFDMGRDGCSGLDGWYVDNVMVTNCEEVAKVESTTQLKVRPKKPEFKEDFKAKIKVKAEGTVPSGKVKLYADGKLVGKGMLEDGKVVIKVTKNLSPGEHKLVAKYLGSDTVKKSKDTVMLTIKP